MRQGGFWMGSWMLDFDYISYILLDYGRLIDDTHFDRYIFVIYTIHCTV